VQATPIQRYDRTPSLDMHARPFVPAVAQTCHSHEHPPAMTITHRHRGTVTVPAPVLPKGQLGQQEAS
jgi:hypothetical protein